jgi:hypothetical protein
MTQRLLFHILGPKTIGDRFMCFHAANPHVYTALVRLAREAKAAGAKKLGMKLLIERLRWEMMIETGGDPWRLNNIYTSRYARLIAVREVDLVGFFEMRELKSR